MRSHRRAVHHADMDDDERAAAAGDWADSWHDQRSDREQPSEQHITIQNPQPFSLMGMTKNYLQTIICACAPDSGFAQDAIEHAIVSGHVPLTGFPENDVKAIMSGYSAIMDNYRKNRQAAHPLLEVTLKLAAEAGLPITEISNHFKDAA